MDQTEITPTPVQSKPRPHWGRWIAAALLLIVALILFLTHPKPQRSDSQQYNDQPDNDQPAASTACDAPTPVFTADFTDPALIKLVNPLGGLNVGSASRSYVQVAKDASGQYQTVPVYVPVDATLTGIFHKRADYGELGVRSEYRLEFMVDCNVTFALDHIANVTDAIAAAGPAEASPTSNIGNSVSIPVKAGDALGSTDGTKLSGSWDFYLFNRSKKSYHVNPDRWESDHNNYADCPYDYFTDEIAAQYYAKLALWDGQKAAGLTCGQASHDKAGTAAGGWFKDDSTDMRGVHLLLSNTATMVEVLREESETSIERNNPRFGFRTYTYTKQPKDMTVGDAQCYSGDSKYLFARLTTADTLETARGTGSCPSTFPTADVEVWQR